MITKFKLYIKLSGRLILLISWLTIFNIIPNITFTQANFPNLTFRSITTKDGLTYNDVRGIAQGDDGQIWIGTGNGLNSYDGNKITNYYQGNNSSFNINMTGIFTMVKDKKNNLWLSDRIGLTKISLNNYKTTYFDQFQDVHQIIVKGEGVCFVTDKGVFQIEDDKIIEIQLPSPNYKIQNTNIDRYFKADIDRNNQLYLTSVIRVHKISNSGQEEKYFQMPTELQVTNLYFDSQNNAWASSWASGLYLSRSDTFNFQQILKPEHAGFITLAAIDWRIGNQDYQLVSFEGDYMFGLLVIDKSTLEYKIYNLKSKVNTFFVDTNNNLWVGTDKGVLIASHLLGEITSIPLISTKTDQTLNPGSVYTIHETQDHFWLTKRYSHGIFKYDKKWNLIKEFGSYKIINVHNYTRTDEGYDFKLVGNTMYSTSDLGMFLIDNTTHARKLIFTPKQEVVRLRTIIPINDTTWFIRSYDRGIYVFNPRVNVFTKKYDLQNNSDKSIINYLFKTSQNVILVSSNLGLYFYDELSDKFILKDHPVFNKLAIFGIAEDQNNIFWVCTNKGILSYDFQKNEILLDLSQYNDMGMASRVNIDKNNNVWFSNAKGYWSWNQKNKRMLKLNFDSGLVTQVGDSYINTGADGMIYLGGQDMVHKLNPDDFDSQTNVSKIIISHIAVNNESKTASYTPGKYALQLPPGNATLDIAFSVPEYSIDQSHSYHFKFFDDATWTNLKDGKIFIPFLSNGQYQIMMKGVSNFSGVETDIVTLDISILPQWYQTWWFKCLLGFCAAAILYLFYQWKMANEKEKNKLKADYEHRMIHLEMQNLRSQMNPHFIFNALNSINGYIVENNTHLASEYLTKFSRLVRMILDHSKSEMIPLAKEIEALNLYVMMEKNRFDQPFDFNIIVDNNIDIDEIEVPPLILQPYIENAIWHGLMHQDKKGLIQINIEQKGDRLIFCIADNGIGIKKAGELKSKKAIKNNSYGMKITHTRIKNHDTSNEIAVTDIVDESGNIAGTKVIISLKIV
ncbi:MAG: histidine kinase [Saprospiraceae bacterium]|nr:histidine kinase [Saprospiraceae bacterium]